MGQIRQISSYEDLYRENEFVYYTLHAAYTGRGLNLDKGAKVKMTDWAIQNGLCGKNNLPKIGYVTGFTRNMRNIKVRLTGHKHPHTYWPGFWEEA